jgi:hypothetical protein
MHEIAAYKSLGLVSFAVLSLGLSFIIIKWPAGIDHTFSQHIAKRSISIVYYIVLFTVVLILLLPFTLKWFSPHFDMSTWFNVFIWVAVICQLLCTFIPEVKDSWLEGAHRLLAFASATAIIPLTLLVALNSNVPDIARIVATVSLILMIYFVIIIGKYKARHPKVLLIQASYFALFFVTLIVATYF